jgi:hypothetical protein
MMHPADLAALALASAIIIQALIFLGVQGTGLKALFVGNCQHIAQTVFAGKSSIRSIEISDS